MRNLRHSPILARMNVQPLRLMISSNHRIRAHDPVIGWQLGSGERSFIRRITDFLSHELVHPFVRLVVCAFVGGEAGDDERHFVFEEVELIDFCW